ncbi:solute carrier family 15 member 1-like isoform X1 [Mobula hypostoma]|uniref:solute carrier family 15 member 1-like isoform X1 n=2 Tax=Mobula hypostoma TaxID=723540 RepID=UPI002FC375B8
MEESETIDFQAMEQELQMAVAIDEKNQRENNAKLKAVQQKVETYEEFRDIVQASHLKPLELQDKLGARNQPWNTYATKEKSSVEVELSKVLLQPADTSMTEYENLDDHHSEGTDNVEPASKPQLPQVNGQAWGRLLKVFDLSLAAIFILVTEFFEKLAYFGLRAILVLYFTDALLLTDSKATSFYHVFIFFSVSFTILGAFLSDFCFGRYRCILIATILFLFGSIILSTTAISVLNGKSGVGSYIGFFLITLGSGCNRSNMSPFGADQIGAKEEKRYRMYFSFYYFSMNLASLISGIAIPILREDVHCFNADCYPLAFGVSAIALLVALVVFGLGTFSYKIYPPTGNMFCKVASASRSALKNKIKWLMNKRKEKAKDHWLDWADPSYEKKIISDAKRLYNLLALFLLLPMYWALYEQQGSRWTLQAQEMNRNVGSLELKPDQLQTLNVFFVLLLLPLFEGVIYPLFEKINLQFHPVARMSIGLFGAVVAFLIAGIVQLQIQKWQVLPQPDGVTNLKIYNGAFCKLNIDFLENHFVMDQHMLSAHYPVPIDPYPLHIAPMHCLVPPLSESINFTMGLGARSTLFIMQDLKTRELTVEQIPDNNMKILDNLALVRILLLLGTASMSHNRTVRLMCKPDTVEDLAVMPSVVSNYTFVQLGRCSLGLSQEAGLSFLPVGGEVALREGGVYTIVLHQANNTANVTMQLLIDRWPKMVSVMWQIPQYLVLAISEILFVVPGLHLAYTQAPSSMRSVTTAAWFAIQGVGNLIVVIIAESTIIKNQAVEFFMFAALMGLISLIFFATSRFYKYQPIDTEGTDKASESDGLNSDLKPPSLYSDKEENR